MHHIARPGEQLFAGKRERRFGENLAVGCDLKVVVEVIEVAYLAHTLGELVRAHVLAAGDHALILELAGHKVDRVVVVLHVRVGLEQKRRRQNVSGEAGLLVYGELIVLVAHERPIVVVEELLARHVVVAGAHIGRGRRLVAVHNEVAVRVGGGELVEQRRPLQVAYAAVCGVAADLVVELLDNAALAQIPQDDVAVVRAAEEQVRLGRMRLEHVDVIGVHVGELVHEHGVLGIPHLDGKLVLVGDGRYDQRVVAVPHVHRHVVLVVQRDVHVATTTHTHTDATDAAATDTQASESATGVCQSGTESRAAAAAATTGRLLLLADGCVDHDRGPVLALAVPDAHGAVLAAAHELERVVGKADLVELARVRLQAAYRHHRVLVYVVEQYEVFARSGEEATATAERHRVDLLRFGESNRCRTFSK